MEALQAQLRNTSDRSSSGSSSCCHVSSCKSTKKVQKTDRLAAKVDELIQQVEECEEEMKRMREEHAAEVRAIRSEALLELEEQKQQINEESAKRANDAHEAAAKVTRNKEEVIESLQKTVDRLKSKVKKLEKERVAASSVGAEGPGTTDNPKRKGNDKGAKDQGGAISNLHLSKLQQDLTASKLEIEKLKRSKRELINNYEKILRGRLRGPGRRR